VARSAKKRQVLATIDEAEAALMADVYGGLDSPDVQLLLDLLAETEGVGLAMRILTLLDTQFHEAWRPQNLNKVISFVIQT
jgi:hypothetical protein